MLVPAEKKLVLPSSAQVLSMSLQIRDAFNQSGRRRILGGHYFDCVGRALRQNLLGRLSFDSVGRALRPKS